MINGLQVTFGVATIDSYMHSAWEERNQSVLLIVLSCRCKYSKDCVWSLRLLRLLGYSKRHGVSFEAFMDSIDGQFEACAVAYGHESARLWRSTYSSMGAEQLLAVGVHYMHKMERRIDDLLNVPRIAWV